MNIILLTTNHVGGLYVAGQMAAKKMCTAIFIDSLKRDASRRKVNFFNRAKNLLKNKGMRGFLGSVVSKMRSGFPKNETKFLKLLEASGRDPSLLSWDQLSHQYNIPIYRVENINDQQAEGLLSGLQPDLNILYGGRILKKNILKIPRLGTINKHSSILPRNRGPAAESWTLFKEEMDFLGITIHYADSPVDSGDIILQAPLKFEKGDTPEVLRMKSHILGAQKISEAILLIQDGKAPRIRQNQDEATMNKVFSSNDEDLLMQKLPALWAKYGG